MFDKLSNAELLAIYNAHAPKAAGRFESRKIGESRTFKVLQAKGLTIEDVLAPASIAEAPKTDAEFASEYVAGKLARIGSGDEGDVWEADIAAEQPPVQESGSFFDQMMEDTDMAKKPAASAPAPAPVPAKPARRNAALEAAEKGIMPDAPDFTAETHKPYRAKLAALVALVEAKNIKGLRAFEIKPSSSSPKALIKYRDLAVIAIQAKRKVAA